MAHTTVCWELNVEIGTGKVHKKGKLLLLLSTYSFNQPSLRYCTMAGTVEALGKKAVIPNLLGASIQHRPYCHRAYFLLWKRNKNRLCPVMINSTEKNALQKREWLSTLCFSIEWLGKEGNADSDIWAESFMKLGSKPQKSSDKEHSRERGEKCKYPDAGEYWQAEENPLLTRLSGKPILVSTSHFTWKFWSHIDLRFSISAQLELLPTKLTLTTPCMCVKAWESTTLRVCS